MDFNKLIAKLIFLATNNGKTEKPNLVTEQVGIWKVILLKDRWGRRLLKAPFILVLALIDFLTFVPFLSRFLKEVFELAPRHALGFALRSLWGSLESGVGLYYTSRLIDVIGQRLQGNVVNKSVIIIAITARISCTLMSSFMRSTLQHHEDILQDRVKFHFMQKSLRWAMSLDLVTAEDAEIREKISGKDYAYDNETWKAFKYICTLLSSAITITSQILLLFTILRDYSAGPMFVALCIIQPLIQIVLARNEIYCIPYFYTCTDAAYARMAALHRLAYSDTFRADRLSDGVGSYVEKEFTKQRSLLGDTCTDYFWSQMDNKQSVLLRALNEGSSEIPVVLFAIKTLFDITNMTVTSLTVLQQTAQTMSWTVSSLSWELPAFRKHLQTVKDIYKLESMQNKIKDGKLEYPAKAKLGEKVERGAQVEFLNVSFTYPGESKEALRGVSFTMKPGQLVVIVGANGSGKSTMVKLFNRLYEPSSGNILLDDKPLESYKLENVRAAMAVLRQNHHLYPLSLLENIILGRPDAVDMSPGDLKAALEDATRQGGAQGFISKMDHGVDTILEPVKLSSVHFPGETVEELKAMADACEKSTDISGGESQRLAASRTFMRLSGGNIRLLVADEPTSALDPEGEFELFTRLRQLRGGKTVVFITHRFGHLTRHADLILCMKDGTLFEQGTHEELIKKGGEYFKLHDVQAQAFL